jgi:O-antigen/teichoic acid export membrane protein
MRAGALTGFAALALAGSAAGAGALLAHKFGRTAATDGFLAAYAIYIVLTVGAQSFRMVVVPDLTRAAAGSRLGEELRSYTLAFVALAVPASVAVYLLSDQIGRAVTGRLPSSAADVAAQAVVWLVPAGFGQLLAALFASALAARDSYGTAAAGYAVGGIAGLVVFAAFANSHGLVALAWGVALNAAVAAAFPLVRLAVEGVLFGPGLGSLEIGRRLWLLVQGATLPIVLQVFYLTCLRLVANFGVGRVTSFSYAYLLAATLVAATASSLGLVSSAPLTRRGLDAAQAAAHIVHSAWVSLTLVGAAAGIFALVGGRVVGVILGSQYHDVGRLVVYLAPWMVTAIAYAVTFPLVFVFGHRRALVPIAVVALVLDLPFGLGLRELWGIPGVAASLALATLGVLVALLASISRELLVLALSGLLRVTLIFAVLTLAAFGLPALVLSPTAAALVGLVVYAIVLAGLRARGLGEAWAYVRALH